MPPPKWKVGALEFDPRLLSYLGLGIMGGKPGLHGALQGGIQGMLSGQQALAGEQEQEMQRQLQNERLDAYRRQVAAQQAEVDAKEARRRGRAALLSSPPDLSTLEGRAAALQYLEPGELAALAGAEDEDDPLVQIFRPETNSYEWAPRSEARGMISRPGPSRTPAAAAKRKWHQKVDPATGNMVYTQNLEEGDVARAAPPLRPARARSSGTERERAAQRIMEVRDMMRRGLEPTPRQLDQFKVDQIILRGGEQTRMLGDQMVGVQPAPIFDTPLERLGPAAAAAAPQPAEEPERIRPLAKKKIPSGRLDAAENAWNTVVGHLTGSTDVGIKGWLKARTGPYLRQADDLFGDNPVTRRVERLGSDTRPESLENALLQLRNALAPLTDKGPLSDQDQERLRQLIGDLKVGMDREAMIIKAEGIGEFIDMLKRDYGVE